MLVNNEVNLLRILFFFLIIAPGILVADEGDMQLVDSFFIDRTEVTVGEFNKFVTETGIVTKAEKTGGGFVFADGWEQKVGWNWRAPFGTKANKDEPAVHITYDEAAKYCEWSGKRLPMNQEWTLSAYTEKRLKSNGLFKYNNTYSYPLGNKPIGANCLNDCGKSVAINYSELLDRGIGHARVGKTKAGINGLYDMGANVWEWVNIDNDDYKGTRGGSWWYGAHQMHRDAKVSLKPREMAAVYIGFRCVKDR